MPTINADARYSFSDNKSKNSSTDDLKPVSQKNLMTLGVSPIKFVNSKSGKFKFGVKHRKRLHNNRKASRAILKIYKQSLDAALSLKGSDGHNILLIGKDPIKEDVGEKERNS